MMIVLFCYIQSFAFFDFDFSPYIDQQIVFLPQPKSLQKYAYREYSYKKSGRPSVSYKDLVCKKATIKEIKYDSPEMHIVFLLENGKRIYGNYYRTYTDLSIKNTSVIPKVGFVSEMDNAQKLIGTTVWLKTNFGRNYIQVYNEETDKYNNIPVYNTEKFTVTNIEWAFFEFDPLRFVLQNDQKTITWDDSYSKINGANEPFTEHWFFEDPKKIYSDWPEEMWELIEQFKVAIGMNKEMVILSWGKPEKINRTIVASGTTEQWIYSNFKQYVYFEDNKVIAIQDLN